MKIGLEALKEIEVVRPQAAEKLAEETLRGEVDAVVAFHQGTSVPPLQRCCWIAVISDFSSP
ncbi:hypothetical protein [Rhizobium sp. YTUHZ045]|uniref:hypothetical protein n=1 Tax=Rhizobium sp. YTUHZ045 TaxID=2962888 RepID=UPI003DA93DD7